MLTPRGCKRRQDRLRELMDRLDLDAVLLSDPHEIYYFTGLLLDPPGSAFAFPALLCFERSGDSWLASHLQDGDALVDERVSYEFHLLFTTNPDPMRRLAEVVAAQSAGRRPPKRVGYQDEALPRLIGEVYARVARPGAWVPIDDDLAEMQRRKDPDEIELLRRSIDCTQAAYQAAKEIIAPGVTELDVREAGHQAATLEARELVFHNGDYQCGEFGGPARDRVIEEGELYIIDGWSTYRGYWSDLCRTFPVGELTALQREVHDFVAAILTGVQDQLKPGLTGIEVWQWLDRKLREHPQLRDHGLIHHGGHAVGLRAHELPDINRDRGEALEPGNVVSIEPGAYLPELRAGVRLENTFLITENGSENLSTFPWRLDDPS
jgi:Xaa-Pro dipeptidase